MGTKVMHLKYYKNYAYAKWQILCAYFYQKSKIAEFSVQPKTAQSHAETK
jgi:hypothetical protein